MKAVSYKELITLPVGTYIGVSLRYNHKSGIDSHKDEVRKVVKILSFKTLGLKMFNEQNKQIIVDLGDGKGCSLFSEYKSGAVYEAIGVGHDLSLSIMHDLNSDEHMNDGSVDWRYWSSGASFWLYDNSQEIKNDLQTYEKTKIERAAEKKRFQALRDQKKQEELLQKYQAEEKLQNDRNSLSRDAAEIDALFRKSAGVEPQNIYANPSVNKATSQQFRGANDFRPSFDQTSNKQHRGVNPDRQPPDNQGFDKLGAAGIEFLNSGGLKSIFPGIDAEILTTPPGSEKKKIDKFFSFACEGCGQMLRVPCVDGANKYI